MPTPSMLNRTLSEEERSKVTKEHTEKITACIMMLCSEWDLRLPLPSGNESPHSRKARGITDEGHCVARIRYLQFKDSLFLSKVTRKFREEAAVLYSNWVHKPKAQRIVPPATRSVPKPLTDVERKQLVTCLRKHLDEAYREAASLTPSKLSFSDRFNDSPIPSPKLSRMKRSSNDRFDDILVVKKSKSLPSGDKNAMLPPNRTDRQTQTRNEAFNPETSFVSTADPIFSRPPSLHGQATQTTIADDEEIPTQPFQKKKSHGWM